MGNCDLGVAHLPDDLTLFITQTTVYPVGGGAFGDVWKCDYNADGISAFVAVKAFKCPESYHSKKINRKIRREIGIVKTLRHNNIVPLLGTATGFGRRPELRCLVTPWIPNGTLNTYLASNRNLTKLDRSRMLEDVSAGLGYLHSLHIVHGDITGANILIDEGGHARLIDFGLSTLVRPLLGQSYMAATSINPGAVRYAAPELVLSDDVYDLPLKKTDLYSFGCVMLQILSGRHPWSEVKSEKPELRIVVLISQGCSPERPNGHPAIMDSDWAIIQKCLQSRPELRPSADEVLDFVMHRVSLSDSSSPSDDPPDDAQDGFPAASPYDDSDDSDTTEQSYNGPPPQPGDELTNVIIEPRARRSSYCSSLPSLATDPVTVIGTDPRVVRSTGISGPEQRQSPPLSPQPPPPPPNASSSNYEQMRPFYIFGLSVDFSHSGKNVESAAVQIGKLHAPVGFAAGKTLRQIFSPPIQLFIGDSFSLRVRHKKFGRKTQDENIDFDTEDIFRLSGARGEPETQEYIKFHNKLKIVVELSVNTATERAAQLVSSFSENMELQPIADEISRICPRFRILLIGQIISHGPPGKSYIDREFISPHNDRFVLHEAQGFEPGEEDNLQKVRDFIDRRRKMPDLKYQLHAVWLCVEIPNRDRRLLEARTETFLTWTREGKLGNIPIVVVFTKYDKLLDRMERTLDESTLEGLSDDVIKELVKINAQDRLQEVCIAPLEKFSGPDIPHVTVSTNGNHEETLAHLIKITEERVRKRVGLEASVALINAQRVDPGFKIMASIEVGKRRYWKALTSSISFKNRTMRDCLNMLHTDIVAVWNFHDPHRHLCSPEFRTLIVNIVEWSDSRTVLQHFMSYLVDLILILQMLDLVSGCQDVTRRAIKLVVASYLASPVSGEVHTRIQEYDRGLTFLERADRDTLDKIAEVITIYSFDAKQMYALRSGIHTAYFSLDEPWEV